MLVYVLTKVNNFTGIDEVCIVDVFQKSRDARRILKAMRDNFLINHDPKSLDPELDSFEDNPDWFLYYEHGNDLKTEYVIYTKELI